MEIPILILAGGQGRRMGYQNKAQLLFQSETFLEKIIAEFRGKPCYISTNATYLPTITNVQLIVDKNVNRGPIEGIIQAFEQTAHTAFFVVGCDMPLMKREVYETLCAQFEPQKGVIVQSGKRYFTLGAIYTREMLEEMKEKVKEKDYRLKTIFHKENSKILTEQQFGMDLECFLNINCEKEYQQLCDEYEQRNRGNI